MVPSALGLVEDHDVLCRRAQVNQGIVTEVMNVLDERFDAFAYFALADPLPLLLPARNFIARERFTQDGDEGVVA